MRFVSVTDVKNEASQIIRHAEAGHPVVVVRHGKPCAAIIRLSEEEVDQLLFEDSPLAKRAVEEALNDLKHKRSVTLHEYLRGKRSP